MPSNRYLILHLSKEIATVSFSKLTTLHSEGLKFHQQCRRRIRKRKRMQMRFLSRQSFKSWRHENKDFVGIRDSGTVLSWRAQTCFNCEHCFSRHNGCHCWATKRMIAEEKIVQVNTDISFMVNSDWLAHIWASFMENCTCPPPKWICLMTHNW